MAKLGGIAEEDSEYVRSQEEAQKILTAIQHIHTQLHALFQAHPSLAALFDKHFLPLSQFFQRSYVLNLCFVDDYLIPEKEMFSLEEEDLEQSLKNHQLLFENWISGQREKHALTQEVIKTSFTPNTSIKQLECQCASCLGDYRSRLRDYTWEQCQLFIQSGRDEIADILSSSNELNAASNIFSDMQRSMEKLFHKVRYSLRRATLGKIEAQAKSKIQEDFAYPNELAIQREGQIKPVLEYFLYQEGLDQELVGEPEFKKFFKQLHLRLWRNESYLLREFKKLVRSVTILKKKDISGKILQQHIGEFWVHSQARSIKRKIVYHMGPTNSGKTHHAIEKLASVDKGCYLAPLRLLAAELFDTLNQREVNTTLLTGEEVIEKEGATHYSSTIEMARLQEPFDCCVIDEIQMITDHQRGWAWTRALVNIFAEEVHLCGDPSVLKLIQNITQLCGDELEVVNYQRMTKLQVEKRPITVGELQRSDALIVFSRRNALRYKRDLERLGFKVSIVYGRLSPEVRREQARKFDTQETDIMVSTDAIAMGMNLPIRRIVFSTLTKHIDSREYPIVESEIKQISGRAGRFKRFPTGFVTCLTKCQDGIPQIEQAIHRKLEQQGQCMVGPDLDIYNQVNHALEKRGLTPLKLSEFLRLFNTMDFQKPFFCVDLKEMIELTEMVEDADPESQLKPHEVFGFACAPVNLGLVEHVQYYVWILKHYVTTRPIISEAINAASDDIDYLETSIKCVELYQWLSRHFNNKNFVYNEAELLDNKGRAIEKLNSLLSDKIVLTCTSCGTKMPDNAKFNICEKCFKEKRFTRRRKKTTPGIRKSSPRRPLRKPPGAPRRRNPAATGPSGPRKKSTRRRRR